METTVKQWLDESRKKLKADEFTETDLQRLEDTSNRTETAGIVSLFKIDKYAFSDCQLGTV